MRGVYLEILDKGKGKRFRARVKGSRIVMGRGGACHLCLVTDSCSRKHAVLQMKGGRWQVTDLGSRNGTFLNEHRVESATVRKGDTIRLGPAGLKIRVLELFLEEPGKKKRKTGKEKKARPKPPRKKPATPPKQPPPKKPAAAPKKPPPKKPKAPRKQPPPKKPPAAPKKPRPKKPSPPPAKHVAPRRRLRRADSRPWLALVPLAALAFGIGVAWDVWGGVVPAFPYAKVMAPVTWAIRGLAEILPLAVAEIGPWLYRAFLVIWFLLIGLALLAPVRRWPWILILAGLHAAAALTV